MIRRPADETARDRNASSRERGGHFDRLARIDLRERAEEVAFHDGHGEAIAISDAIARDGADAIAGGEDADEVQRIGGADDDDLAIGRSAANLAQALDRFRQ